MTPKVLDKLIELKKDSDYIRTHQLTKEFMYFDENSFDIVDELIKNKIIERVVEEKLDMCSLKTKKLERIIKLKNLSD